MKTVKYTCMHNTLFDRYRNFKGFWAKLYVHVRVPSPGDSDEYGRDTGPARVPGGGRAGTVARDPQEFPRPQRPPPTAIQEHAWTAG